MPFVEVYNMVKILSHLVQPLLSYFISYSTPFRSPPPLATMLTSFRAKNAKLLVFYQTIGIFPNYWYYPKLLVFFFALESKRGMDMQ